MDTKVELPRGWHFLAPVFFDLHTNFDIKLKSNLESIFYCTSCLIELPGMFIHVPVLLCMNCCSLLQWGLTSFVVFRRGIPTKLLWWTSKLPRASRPFSAKSCYSWRRRRWEPFWGSFSVPVLPLSCLVPLIQKSSAVARGELGKARIQERRGYHINIPGVYRLRVTCVAPIITAAVLSLRLTITWVWQWATRSLRASRNGWWIITSLLRPTGEMGQFRLLYWN